MKLRPIVLGILASTALIAVTVIVGIAILAVVNAVNVVKAANAAPKETIKFTGEVVETSPFSFTGRGWLTLRVNMDHYQTLVHVNVIGREDDQPRTRLVLKRRFVHDLLYHQVEVTAVRGRYGFFFARTIQEL